VLKQSKTLDYGESHYISKIKGAQPNSEAWCNGFPHEAWLSLNAYYAQAFKEGRYPAIHDDRVWMWARPHLKDTEAPDEVPRPRNWELVTFHKLTSSSCLATDCALSDRGLLLGCRLRKSACACNHDFCQRTPTGGGGRSGSHKIETSINVWGRYANYPNSRQDCRRALRARRLPLYGTSDIV
jgi:hypothetical protein